jgi:hypothetical protein
MAGITKNAEGKEWNEILHKILQIPRSCEVTVTDMKMCQYALLQG